MEQQNHQLHEVISIFQIMFLTSYPPLYAFAASKMAWHTYAAGPEPLQYPSHWTCQHKLWPKCHRGECPFYITKQIVHNTWIMTNIILSLTLAYTIFIQQHICYTLWVTNQTFLSATSAICHSAIGGTTCVTLAWRDLPVSIWPQAVNHDHKKTQSETENVPSNLFQIRDL